MLRIASLTLAALLCSGNAAVPVEQGLTLSFRIEPVEPAGTDSATRMTVDLLRKRLDLEVVLSAEGSNGVTVTVPLSSLAEGTVAGALGERGTSLRLASGAEGLAVRGGLLLVDDEVMRYRWREGDEVRGLERGALGTSAASHAAGVLVRAVEGELLRRIESIGELRFLIGADDTDFQAAGTDARAERERLDAWLADGGDVDDYNRLARDEGGPPAGIGWFALRSQDHHIALRTNEDERWRFDLSDMERFGEALDELGYPAVSFLLRDDRREAFGDFTGAHVDEDLGVVLDGRIVTLARINSRLPGKGILSGGVRGFDAGEVDDLLAVLRHGPLPGRPVLTGVEVR